MPLARLVFCILIVISLSAFAQVQESSAAGQRTAGSESATLLAKDSPTEAWHLFSNEAPGARSSQDPLMRLENGEDAFKISRDVGANRMILPSPDLHPGLNGQPDNTVCYTIRSYVVARDEKDSDSTHPVSSSTCRRASRYLMKEVETAPAALVR